MKAKLWIAAALCTALASSACLAGTETEVDMDRVVEARAEALTLGQAKTVTQYYALRRDVRRCAFPLCGGYWAALVNGAPTICADGSEAAECYVAELTLPGGVAFADADIVHGQLELKNYPEPDLTVGVLRADGVFGSVLGVTTSRKVFALAYDSGIRCIRAPCPSIGVARLNSEAPGVNTSELTFSAPDAESRAALEEAYSEEFSRLSVLGQGAVMLGRSQVVWNRRSTYRRFVITDVYAEKAGNDPVCLVDTGELNATAWNFPSLEAATDLISGLTGKVDLYVGRCGELELPCTREYAPVHGIIDALGEVCVDAGNACELRSRIIHAAGTDSKAAGRWNEGSLCYESAACEEDAECAGGFCGWAPGDTRTCRPWAQAGEHCEGFVRPQDWRVCAPGLVCELSEPTGDAGGTCVKP